MASSIQATFGENQPLRSRLVWRTKSGSAGVVRTPPPIFPHWADGAQNLVNVVIP